MLTLEVLIKDDAGNMLGYAKGPATQPLQLRIPPDKPILTDPINESHYKIWSVIAQPQVTLHLKPTR